MVIEVAEQVVAVIGSLTGAVLLAAMVVSGWVGPRPARVRGRVRR